MPEKEPVKISFSTWILIIALIVIIVMAYFIYSLNKRLSAVEKQNNNIDISDTIKTTTAPTTTATTTTAPTTTSIPTSASTTNTVKPTVAEPTATSVPTTKTVNTKWEEYPTDINAKNEQWLGVIAEDQNSVKYNLMKKTIYSLSQKNANQFAKLYFNGDSLEIIEKDSNYARYCYPDNSNNDLSAKYTKKIEYSLAIFNESYYDGDSNLETATKHQYEQLKDKNYYYQLNQIAIMNGNNESKEEYLNNSRAKKIKVTVDNKKQFIFELEDTNSVQLFDINYNQSTIENPVKVEIEVLEKYNGAKSEDVYISDIQFSIDSNIPMGR